MLAGAYGEAQHVSGLDIQSISVEAAAENTSPTLQRLENQIDWYSRKSASNQRFYKWLKGLTMISAVSIPILSARDWGRLYAGALGVAIVLAEGLQQLNQFQANWIAYRSTSESLKHEKYLYLARAGPYASPDNPLALLAERIEGLVSQEHAKWVSAQEEGGKKSPQAAVK